MRRGRQKKKQALVGRGEKNKQGRERSANTLKYYRISQFDVGLPSD